MSPHNARWLTPALCLCALVACQPDSPGSPANTAGDASNKAPSAAANNPSKAPEPPGEQPGEVSGHMASALRVVDAITELEVTKDVTCWTSFRQLDSFVATRQYSEYATLTKIAAIKSLTRALWRRASQKSAASVLDASDLEDVASLERVALLGDRKQALGTMADELGMKAFADYRKTSEHWRVVLSLLEDELRQPTDLKPLTEKAEQALSEHVTTLSLALLVNSGEQAIIAHSPMIEAEHVRQAHKALAERYGLQSVAVEPSKPDAKALDNLRQITGKLIEGKVKALRHYNKSEGSVAADLQKISNLPLDPGGVDALVKMARDFARFFVEGRDPMRADNYYLPRGPQPGQRGDKAPTREYIDAVYAQNTIMQRFPHAMMANGDILLRYEPNPGTIRTEGLKGQEVRLLDHQMNAVRDTAIHWLLLQELHKARPFAMDTFAAEYLSEVVSMAMTLYIRRAQTITRQLKAKALTAQAVARVQSPAYVLVPPRSPEAPGWGDKDKAAKEAAMANYKAPLFENITQAAGLPTELSIPQRDRKVLGDIQTVMGAGLAVGDVNGDDYPDLFVAGEGLGKLYINKGKQAPGVFEDATEAWKVPGGLFDSRGSLFIDHDGDGDLDLLVLRSASPSLLLDNTGTAFVDVAAKRGFAPGKGAHVASAFDYDGDGDLDLHVGFYGSQACNRGPCAERNLPALDGLNGTPNQLWQRQDDGSYKEVGAQAGIDHRGWTLATGTFDHDGDGDLDLYVANDFGANVFYENQGDGTFKDISAVTGTADRGSGMNVSFSDVNNDGRMDFYLTNIDMFSKNIKVVFPTDTKTVNLDDATLRSFRYISGNKLYVGSKDGRYTSQEAQRFEPGDRGWSWAGVFFDVENDGDEDLYLSNGWIESSYAHNQNNQLLVRDDQRFYLAPQGSPEGFAGNSRSVIASDIDRDGDLDLVVNNFRQPPVVLRNTQQTGNNWVGLKLVGEGLNTGAVGAQISIKAGKGTISRQVTAGIDYLGQQDHWQVIGLGDRKSKQVSARIRWPNGQETTVSLKTKQWTVVQHPKNIRKP